MLTKELEYDLPAERIAQFPIERRDESRLLVYHRDSGETQHCFFHELPDVLPNVPEITIVEREVEPISEDLIATVSRVFILIANTSKLIDDV